MKKLTIAEMKDVNSGKKVKVLLYIVALPKYVGITPGILMPSFRRKPFNRTESIRT